MPRLEFSYRFADDLAQVTSLNLEQRIFDNLDNIEAFGEFGPKNIPDSIRARFGDGVRKVVVGSFDLVYTLSPDSDVAFIEALVPQRAAK